MNKNKIVTAVLILLLIVVVLLTIKFVFHGNGNNSSLLSPLVKKVTQPAFSPKPTPTPNVPQTINFDSSTDLKKELDNVNPQVLDSDFN